MDIRSLPSEVRSLLRSGININDVSHCVQELVFNSLDAKSTAIAVRINLQNFRVQVVDNGRGISKFDMGFIGVRYTTSKCQSLQDLKHRMKYYGFRGESLASIANVSEKLTVTSKLIGTDCTYSKVIEKKQFSDVRETSQRAEHGTTVTVENFLYNMPVRRKCIKTDQGAEDVKNYLELLVVIHPKVSFSLRNDANLKVILKVNKTNSVLHSFINLHPEIYEEDISLCEVSKSHVTMSGLISKKSHKNKRLQLIFVNKRPVVCSKIYKQIKTFYKQACKNTEFLQTKDYPVYVLNILCPYSEVDLTHNSSKTNVEFKNWNLIMKCIEKLFRKVWGIDDIKHIVQKKVDAISNAGISISNMLNVVKTKPVKRKSSDISNAGDQYQNHIILESSVSPKKVNNFPKKKKTKQFFLADSVTEIKDANNEKVQLEACKESTSELASSNMNMRIFSCNNQQQQEGSVELFSNERNDLNCQVNLEDQSQGKDLIMNYFLKSAVAFADDYNSARDEKCLVSRNSTISDENGSSGVCVEKTEKNFCTTKHDHNTTMTYSVKVTTKKTIRRSKQEAETNYDGALSTITFNHISKKKRGELLNKICYARNYNQADGNRKFVLNKCYAINDAIGFSDKCVQTSFSNDLFAGSKKLFKSKAVQTDEPPFVNVYGSDKDIDVFHYYLPEEQEDVNQYQAAPSVSNLNFSKYFLHGEKKNAPNYFGQYYSSPVRKTNDHNDISIDLAPEDITFFSNNFLSKHHNPKDLYGGKNVNQPFKNRDFFHTNKSENPFLVNRSDNATSHYQEFFTNNPTNLVSEKKDSVVSFNSSLFTLDDITISPQKKKCRVDKNTFLNYNKTLAFKESLYKNKTDAQQRKYFTNIEEDPRERKSSKDVDKKKVKASASFPNDNTLTVCKRSFEDLFKSEEMNGYSSKSGFLGGASNFLKIENPTNSKNTEIDEEQEALITLSNCNDKKTLRSTATEPLLFSMKDCDKNYILQSDLDLEEKLNKKKNEVTLDCDFVQIDGFNKKQQTGDEWDRISNIFESNGANNIFDPPTKENVFKFKERLDFLPKGCSPIMQAFSKVDKILSPNSKEFLQKSILQSFEDELQTVKWQNYLNDNDLVSFFNELYRQKAKQFERTVPKILPTKLNSRTTFSRHIFDEIDLLSQVDKKFIATVDKQRKQLYFFDQHAVHERIRVEMLFKEYRQDHKYQSVPRYRSTHCKQKVYVNLNDFDVKVMMSYKTAFTDVGLEFRILENIAEIIKVPLCFVNKVNRTHYSGSGKTLECLVKALIFEVIETLKSTKGCLVSTPSIINDVINSEACRGAVKFGDFLTLEKMEQYLSRLKLCNLPFQCAHGRPTLAPVVTLQEQVAKSLKPNLKNLCKCL